LNNNNNNNNNNRYTPKQEQNMEAENCVTRTFHG